MTTAKQISGAIGPDGFTWTYRHSRPEVPPTGQVRDGTIAVVDITTLHSELRRQRSGPPQLASRDRRAI